MKLPRGSYPHPALDEFISEFQASDFDLGGTKMLSDTPTGTVFLVPWISAPRVDRYDDSNFGNDKAVVKIIGQNWCFP